MGSRRKKPPPRRPPRGPEGFPIVGVGASAGGLAAFRRLLAALPVHTGMAFVLVPHLDPRHDSILAELLAKRSRMPVSEVEKDTTVQPNHVYVTPGQQDVTIEGGMLRLVPRVNTRGLHMPIDSFLRTLAEARRSRGIGVILSGTGSDGTLGVQAIKAEGGIAFAQEPGSAEYDGMPRSAIASGCVDFVLPPEQIAQELSRLSQHPYVITPPREKRADDPMLSRGITVTSFFRDPEVFQVFCQEVLPRLLEQRPPGAPIRVWVPGCATGEEVYSIVICLLEGAGEAKDNPPFQVFATDLSESAVEKARAGRYPENIARDVSPERLGRFFTMVDGRYQVSKAIRDMCVFARHDLTRDPPFGRLDLISGRNLFPDLEPRLQERVLAIFHYALRPSGFLLLGASETAVASPDLFAPADRKHRVYRKRPPAAPAVPGFEPPAAVAPPASHQPLPREADEFLLARYAPAGVIVDDKDNIVEFRGHTDPYLEHAHGRASLRLFDMARKGLLLGIRQAIQEARKKDAPSRKEGLSLLDRGQVRRLDLEVVPLKGSPEKGRSLLVLFEARPDTEIRRGRPAKRPPRAATAEARESANLRQELAEATRYLRAEMQEHEAANEELRAANEEALSANEELQSINEEMETAKEELQSSNEELATLNQELRERNLRTERALDYSNGIVETVRDPLLILDAGLHVERANRSFYGYFQVTPEETAGKLVYELGQGQWDIPALREALEQVLPRDTHFEDFKIEHDFPRIGRRTLVLNARTLRQDSGRASILLAIEDRTEVTKA